MSRQQPEFSQPMRGNLRLRDDDLFDDAGGGESGGEGMLHFKDLLPRLLARWHWILLCALLGLGWGLYTVWRAVPLYQSRATVLVRDYNVTAMGQLDSAEFDLRNTQAIETVRAGMTRFRLFELVAADPLVRELEGLEPPKKPLLPFFGVPEKPLEGDVPSMSKLAGMIAGWVAVEVRPDTRLIDIAVKHPRPEVSQVIANRLVHHYIEDRTESRSSGQQTNLEFLIEESKRVKDELQAAQSVLTAYSAPLDAEKALAAAETAVGTLSLRYRAKHPKMIEAQARLEQAEKTFRQFMGRAVRNPSDLDYWASHLARVGDLDTPGAIGEMRDLLVSRRAVLESEIESQNSLYRSLLGQIETREVSVKQTEAEVAPHEMARPGRHVYPQKTRMVIQGTVLGLFAGLGLAFLFHVLDNKLHTVADVEKQFNAPVLSAIAAIDAGSMAPKKGRKPAPKPGEDEALVAARQHWDPLLVFHAEGGKTHYAEMFRVLRTSISLLGPPEQRKITMVTSALPSEGKTFVATNLAVALAQQGLN
ncbi:MAG: hypothetical protein HKO57_04790, partial [Akkermansiaceae bacterium]|nr:hypothetical protein [Akkermansiaceae bacterium]